LREYAIPPDPSAVQADALLAELQAHAK